MKAPCFGVASGDACGCHLPLGHHCGFPLHVWGLGENPNPSTRARRRISVPISDILQHRNLLAEMTKKFVCLPPKVLAEVHFGSTTFTRSIILFRNDGSVC